MTSQTVRGDKLAPIDDEFLLSILPQCRRLDSTIDKQAAADAIGRSRSGVQRALARLARQGRLGTLPVLPGFEIKRTTSVTDADGEVVREFVTQQQNRPQANPIPEGFEIKRLSRLKTGTGGLIQEWEIAEPGKVVRSPEKVAEIFKNSFDDYVPCSPLILPPISFRRCLTAHLYPDLHLGLFCWRDEVDVNWDLKVAEQTIITTAEEIHRRSPPSEIGVVMWGGDAGHADNRDNMTEQSRNILQVDGRYDKVLEVICRVAVRTVELALMSHAKVIFRALKGNHDWHIAVALVHFIRAWFRGNPRVEVDISPSLFWFYQYGNNFLAAHHGDQTKAESMPMKMASDRPDIWGRTKHRRAWVFHWHNSKRIRDTIGGVVVEVFESPIPKDAWHHGKSFLSGRSLCSITYDYERGEHSRVTENI